MAASRFIKPPTKSSEPTQAEVRRAKDFWADVFEATINGQVNEDSAGHAKPGELVEFAGHVADAALLEMEKRWTKI